MATTEIKQTVPRKVDLATFLSDREYSGLEVKPVYFPDGDFVSLFIADELAYEERLSDLVTLYRSNENGQLVGCKVKGVKRILKQLGDFGVIIKDSKVQLGMLFLGADLLERSTVPSEYADLRKRYGVMEVDQLHEQAA